MTKQDDDIVLPWHEEKLTGVELICHSWHSTVQNEHDHCVFCWDKFAEYDGCLHEGYSTRDCYYWICQSCFHALQARFRWNVIDE